MNSRLFKISVTIFVYEMVRQYRQLIGDVVDLDIRPWSELSDTEKLPWFEMVAYRLLTPFADATGIPWGCLDNRGWLNKRERQTAHELVANVCRIMQLGLLKPDADCCNKHAALSITTMFNCGLPKGHPGVCVPAGADPIPTVAPTYQPGDDE